MSQSTAAWLAAGAGGAGTGCSVGFTEMISAAAVPASASPRVRGQTFYAIVRMRRW